MLRRPPHLHNQASERRHLVRSELGLRHTSGGRRRLNVLDVLVHAVGESVGLPMKFHSKKREGLLRLQLVPLLDVEPPVDALLERLEAWVGVGSGHQAIVNVQGAQGPGGLVIAGDEGAPGRGQLKHPDFAQTILGLQIPEPRALGKTIG